MNLFKPEVIAARIMSLTEQKPFSQCMEAYGVNGEDVFEPKVSMGSSESFIRYLCRAQEDKGSELYVVKKVFCNGSDYDGMASAVKEGPSRNFDMIRCISQDSNILGFGDGFGGMATYMVRGEDQLEAIAKSYSRDPDFSLIKPGFNGHEAGVFDALVMQAYIEYSVDSCKKAIQKEAI